MPAFSRSINRPTAEADQLWSEHLKEWRSAAKRVARAWDYWLAADESERDWAHEVYSEALAREEQAALVLARDADALQSRRG
jgi:hypothetical protein